MNDVESAIADSCSAWAARGKMKPPSSSFWLFNSLVSF